VRFKEEVRQQWKQWKCLCLEDHASGPESQTRLAKETKQEGTPGLGLEAIVGMNGK